MANKDLIFKIKLDFYFMLVWLNKSQYARGVQWLGGPGN